MFRFCKLKKKKSYNCCYCMWTDKEEGGGAAASAAAGCRTTTQRNSASAGSGRTRRTVAEEQQRCKQGAGRPTFCLFVCCVCSVADANLCRSPWVLAEIEFPCRRPDSAIAGLAGPTRSRAESGTRRGRRSARYVRALIAICAGTRAPGWGRSRCGPRSI